MNHLPDPQNQPAFYQGVSSKRLLAWIIDTILILACSLVAVMFTAFTGLFFFPLLFAAVGFVYRVATLANGSATWGMRFVAIELRANDGARFDLGLALAHTFGYTVSFTLPLIQLVSIVLMLTDSRGQGLTDKVLGTVALNRRV